MNNMTFKSIVSEVASSIYADAKDVLGAKGLADKNLVEAAGIQTADKVNMASQYTVEKLNKFSDMLENKSSDALNRMVARNAARRAGNKPAGPVAVPAAAANTNVVNADGSVSYVFGKKVA